MGRVEGASEEKDARCTERWRGWSAVWNCAGREEYGCVWN